MRISSITVVALATAAVFLLSACSGGTSATPAGSASSVGMDAIVPDKLATPPHRLAVSLFTSVVVLDSNYKVIQTITNGLHAADGDYYDLKGNLYVAQAAGPYVTEYNKAGTLISTYSADLTDPISVTVDHSENVYIPDGNDGKAGLVVEYPQGSNTPTVSCNTGLANVGVAIDDKGNVFVAGETPGKYTNQGVLLEYTGGLSGCNATALGVTFGSGVAAVHIDKHGNLLVCDSYAGGVDIVPPPYSKIRKTITGVDSPVEATLNKEQNLIYIANNQYNNPTVVVDKYPSGANVTTLGTGDGITYAAVGVAAYR